MRIHAGLMLFCLAILGVAAAEEEAAVEGGAPSTDLMATGITITPKSASHNKHRIGFALDLSDGQTVSCTMVEKDSASQPDAQCVHEHANQKIANTVCHDAHDIYQCDEGKLHCVVSYIDEIGTHEDVVDGLCIVDTMHYVHFHKHGDKLTSMDPLPAEVKGAACSEYVPSSGTDAAKFQAQEEAHSQATAAAEGTAKRELSAASGAGGAAGGVAAELKSLADQHAAGLLSTSEWKAAKAAALHMPAANEPAIESLELWTDCYHNDHITRRLNVGVAITSRLSQRLANPEQWAATQVAETNLVFREQFNIVLTVGDYYVVDGDVDSTGRQGPSWNSPNCAIDIHEQLRRFKDWVHNDAPRKHGVWHLFDDCYRQGANRNAYTIGLAYVGTLCNWFNSGVTFTGGETWKTFAHEIGHNFGAQHSFEEGQGKTGGIMDYGDGKLAGEYQFNTKYRKPQMCKKIASKVRVCPHFSFHVSRCGNHILDDGEECDGGDSYCSEDCKLSCPAGFYATRRGTCSKVVPKKDDPGAEEGGGGTFTTIGIILGVVVAAGVGYKFFIAKRRDDDDPRMPHTQRTVDAYRDAEENEGWKDSLLNPLYRGAGFVTDSVRRLAGKRKSNLE